MRSSQGDGGRTRVAGSVFFSGASITNTTGGPFTAVRSTTGQVTLYFPSLRALHSLTATVSGLLQGYAISTIDTAIPSGAVGRVYLIKTSDASFQDWHFSFAAEGLLR